MTEARTMSADRRTTIYQVANGSWRLTPKQRRRVAHKRNHAMAPFTRPESAQQ